MIYLVNGNVYTFNNGPEFSQFERLQVLNESGIKTKLLLKEYSPSLIDDLKRHQINPKYVINMYDFFQGRLGIEERDINIHQIPSVDLSYYHLVNVDPNHSLLTEAGNDKATVNVAPGTVGLTGNIEAQDRFGHKLQREIWDRRGFLSRIDYFHWNGSLGTSRYLKPNGSTALLVTRMNNNGNLQKTMWKILNYQGRNFVFDSEDQLFIFFLNEVNKQQQGVFVSDRRNFDWPVLMVKNARKKLTYFHTIPFKDKNNNPQLMSDAQLAIDPNLTMENHFDSVIVPTQEQARQMKKLYPNSNFTAVNDSFVNISNSLNKPSQKNNSQIKLVYRGMLSPDKNLKDILEAFKKINTIFPRSVLEMQGYFISKDYREALEKFVNKLKIAHQVRFVTYSAKNDLSIFHNASLFLNATHQEAFGMNMLEALSCGVPVVAYDESYLANNLVKDGENGILVRHENARSLAKAALRIIRDPALHRQLSSGALHTAKQFSKQQLVNDWKQLVK